MAVVVALTSGTASAVEVPGGPEIPIEVPPIYVPELGSLPLGPTPLGAKGAHRPVPAPSGCGVRVKPEDAGAAVNAAKQGDRICVVGGSERRMDVFRTEGRAQPNVTLTGDGSPIKGIMVVGDNIVVENFDSIDATAPGVLVKGNDITLRNMVIDNPRDADNDGIRFFGSRIRILNNTITNVRNTGGAHADCMQTYTKDGDPKPPVVITDTPSDHVLIDSNRCERIDNQCLIAEGPNDGEGSGNGHSHDIIFSRNLCDAAGLAYQAVMLEDIQRVTIAFNDIQGPIRKAFAFDIGSTEGKVVGNRLDPRIPCHVGMDQSSRPGYVGPEPTCEP
ncbi:hypothetical protein GCM10023321_78430 [Pseudonocardia eucalypti]|uniref:Right handed beta helix domain-containing protein n=1 Tax=Pseudonocardia eucalypti TaxID=648755 RepID=A0ABP9RBU2_9PSEU|nr:hypothetical protein [Pseudonocardia eucalypti]